MLSHCFRQSDCLSSSDMVTYSSICFDFLKRMALRRLTCNKNLTFFSPGLILREMCSRVLRKPSLIGWRVTMPEDHSQSFQNKGGGNVFTHGPANDFAAVSLNRSDAGHPELVGGRWQGRACCGWSFAHSRAPPTRSRGGSGAARSAGFF